MSIPTKIIMATIVAAASAPALAMTGNDLHGYCNEKSPNYMLGLCEGFIIGYSTGFSHGRNAEGSSIVSQLVVNHRASLEAVFMRTDDAVFAYCPPKGVTNGQRIEVATAYLSRHPAIRHQYAGDLVVKAMVDAWPCER